MQYPVGDKQANQLAARFFEAIAAFHPVDVALAEARKSIMVEGQVNRDVIAPVLYLQAADGALFQKARNWPVIGLGIVVPIAIIALLLLFQSNRTKSFAQQTAQAENSLRIEAQVNEEIAKNTAMQNKLIAEAKTLADRALEIQVLNCLYY